MKLLDGFAEGEFTLPIELSEQEIQDRQSEYFSNLRALEIEERKLADFKARIKEQTDPLTKKNKVLFQEIKDGFTNKTVRATEFPDEDNATIQYYDMDGVLIHTRAMTPSEKQQYRIKFGRAARQMAD